MVERDQGKGAEGPEDEGMRQAGKRALANDFALEEHLPDKIPNALADGEEVKAGVFLRFEDFVKDGPEAAPETRYRCHSQTGEEQLLRKGEVPRLSQGWKKNRHRRTKTVYTATIQD